MSWNPAGGSDIDIDNAAWFTLLYSTPQMGEIVNSQAAMDEIADSQTAMGAVAASETAMDTIIASEDFALPIVYTSETAMSTLEISNTFNNNYLEPVSALEAFWWGCYNAETDARVGDDYPIEILGQGIGDDHGSSQPDAFEVDIVEDHPGGDGHCLLIDNEGPPNTVTASHVEYEFDVTDITELSFWIRGGGRDTVYIYDPEQGRGEADRITYQQSSSSWQEIVYNLSDYNGIQRLTFGCRNYESTKERYSKLDMESES